MGASCSCRCGLSRADEVRTKLEQLGITEHDVDAAVAWARKGR